MQSSLLLLELELEPIGMCFFASTVPFMEDDGGDS